MHTGFILTWCACLLCNLLLEVWNSLIRLQMPPDSLFSSTSVEDENATVNRWLIYFIRFLFHFDVLVLYSIYHLYDFTPFCKCKTNINNSILTFLVLQIPDCDILWYSNSPHTTFGLTSSSHCFPFVAYCNLCVFSGEMKVLPDCRSDFLCTPSQNTCARARLDSSMHNWNTLSLV